MMQNSKRTNDTILMLIDYLKQCHVDPEQLCSLADVPFELISQQECTLSIDQEERIWLAAIRLTKDQAFGLNFGQNFYQHAKGHILLALIANSPTVEVAFDHMSRYHALLHSDRKMVIELKGDADRLSCRCSYKSKHASVSRHIVEAFMSGIYVLGERLSGERITILEVKFSHNNYHGKQLYQELFKVPVQFNQEGNEIVFLRESLTKKITLANPDFLKVLLKHTNNLINRAESEKSVTEKVIEELADAELLKHGSVREVARRLALSPRALQSKLKLERQTFRTIRDTVKRDVGMELLKMKDYPIVEIAFELGFSDQSSFNKAFKQWTNMAPSQYRKKHI